LTAFNDNGQYAFAAGFSDGTSGVFVSSAAAIPEPSVIALAGLAALLVAPASGRAISTSGARTSVKPPAAALV
jgi:hypothetical protein